MDAVNWLAHGKHGDKPECACPVIGAYVIRGNDRMDDITRQRLKAYLHRIAGSRSKAHETVRLRILILAAVRVFTPVMFDQAGLIDEAEKLRALPNDATFTELKKAAKAAAEAAEAAAAEAAAWAAAWAAWAVEAAETAETAEAARAAAAVAARSASKISDWDLYFTVLDDALNAGPQGEPWSVDVIRVGHDKFNHDCATRAAKKRTEPCSPSV